MKHWPLMLLPVPWIAFVIACTIHLMTLGTAEVETVSRLVTASTIAIGVLSLFAIVKSKGRRTLASGAVFLNAIVGLWAMMWAGMSLTSVWF